MKMIKRPSMYFYLAWGAAVVVGALTLAAGWQWAFLGIIPAHISHAACTACNSDSLEEEAV